MYVEEKLVCKTQKFSYYQIFDTDEQYHHSLQL